MEKVVVDSSVAVKWFIDEEESARALHLLKDHTKEKLTLFAPDILILEVINALFFSAHFPNSDYHIAIDKLFKFELNLISINYPLIKELSRFMSQYQITVYDSLFIALAEKENCPLITADKKHHQKRYSKKIKYLDEL